MKFEGTDELRLARTHVHLVCTNIFIGTSFQEDNAPILRHIIRVPGTVMLASLLKLSIWLEWLEQFCQVSFWRQVNYSQF